MTRHLIIAILFILTVLTSQAQDLKSFKLTDTKVDTGSVLKARNVFWKMAICSLSAESNPFLDSLVVFLNVNPNVRLKIIRKEIAQPEHSEHYSKCRAEDIKKYLVEKGIESTRLISEGYTLVSDKELTDRVWTSEKIATILVIIGRD
jgi:hypothetical protein